MRENTVTLTVSLWDFGCLPVALAKEIAAVERQVRVNQEDMSDRGFAHAEQYLQQLKACLREVHAVSKSPMSAEEAEAIKAQVLGVKRS